MIGFSSLNQSLARFIPVAIILGAAGFHSSLEATMPKTKPVITAEEGLSMDAIVRTYFDEINEKIRNGGLLESREGDSARRIARKRTLKILLAIDKDKKRQIIIFLRDKKLIQETRSGDKLVPSVIKLKDADLRWVNLHDEQFVWADFSGADMRGANLFHANFSGADLIGSILIGADVRGVNFSEGGMFAANFADLDARGAVFQQANLAGVRLDRARLHGADLVGANGLDREQLDSAFGDGETQVSGWMKRPVSWR